MEFKELYQQTPDDAKLKFLEAITSQNPELQKQFIRCVETSINRDDSYTFKDFFRETEETKNLYLSLFEGVDLEDPDLDNYVPPHSGYLEEWEVYQAASEQELDEIFGQFRTSAFDVIIQHQPERLLALLIGLFEAITDTDLEDPYGSFGDIHEYLFDEFDVVMLAVVDKVKLSPLGESVIVPAWTLFFSYYDRNPSAGIGFARTFEPLLMALAEKPVSREKLLPALDQSSLSRENIPLLTLLLMEMAQDMEGWLKTAQQTYREDEEVARKLLKHYYTNDSDKFKKLSRELYEKENFIWSAFLKDFVSPENDIDLYIDVFYQLTIHKTDISYYKKVNSFLSEEQKNTLLEKVNWNKPIVTQILSIEKRYADIKKMIESGCLQSDFQHVIAPILEVYPDFCFREITSRVYKTLENARGRSTYQVICDWLSLSQKIPGFIKEKQDVISQLYHHKPNLPALKDELRKAGLVN